MCTYNYLSSLKINENMTTMTKCKLFPKYSSKEVNICKTERLFTFSMKFNFLNLQEINTFPLIQKVSQH